MRLNKYIARASGISRRAADRAIEQGKVAVNGQVAGIGQDVTDTDDVTLDGSTLTAPGTSLTIMLNKPIGYVVSRDGQGSRTIYDLLPDQYLSLKPVGRLDKDSSGLLLLTNDGNLAHKLTHPKFQKTKIYKIALNKPLLPKDQKAITDGVELDDGLSRLELKRISQTDDNNWKVVMQEGRNRQIRRTFEYLGYNVVKLHRTQFGPYSLDSLSVANYREL